MLQLWVCCTRIGPVVPQGRLNRCSDLSVVIQNKEHLTLASQLFLMLMLFLAHLRYGIILKSGRDD